MPAAPPNVGLLRRELDSALAREQVEAPRRSDIMLVLGEAASNVVVHAYRPLPPGLLFVDAAITGRTLLLRVCDCGRGIQPRADSPGLGIGLSLMSRLSDGLEIARNRSLAGTRVSAVFHDVMPADGSSVRPPPRRSPEELEEYAAGLGAASARLADDRRALMAEAQHALDQRDRLRAERHDA